MSAADHLGPQFDPVTADYTGSAAAYGVRGPAGYDNRYVGYNTPKTATIKGSFAATDEMKGISHSDYRPMRETVRNNDLGTRVKQGHTTLHKFQPAPGVGGKSN